MLRETFLPLSKPHITEDEKKAVSEVIDSGWWTTGPKVVEFENCLGQYLNEKDPLHCVALDSCTSALYLSLLALGIGEGDEVIVPTWTFAATAHAVQWVGAKLILCDIDKDTLNIDIKKSEALITPNTKAIIPVHIGGYPCDMNGIAELASKYKLKVIEDAAHAIGTKYNNIKIGNFSDTTCFSFYATKNLAMGEGGAAVSPNPEIIERIRKLGYFGINKQAFNRYGKSGSAYYDIEELGHKANLSSLHGAIGLVQLGKLDWMNNKRREMAQVYKEKLSTKLTFTHDSMDHYHSYHLFPIILPSGVERDSFMDSLKERNIGTSIHFIPLHLHSYYQKQFRMDDFPVANERFERILSIPLFPSMTHEDICYVVDQINGLLN